MNYSRFQRSLSSFLIFSILFLQTVEVPFMNSTRAEAKTSSDIISIIVDEDIYSGDVKSKIFRYAQDVQAYLPNTRTVIVPISKNANPFDIASLNEKLYYEGDGGGLSRLVGTVLVWDLPLPVVHRNEQAFLSVYPYVDFENKSFVYNTSKGYYDYSDHVSVDEKPEIWHSIIRPNTGDASVDRDKLLGFFDKTHDFYGKQGNFSSENTLSEPRVFYFDGLHDEKSSGAVNWKLYEMYLKSLEDVTYNRFSKYLADSLYSTSQRLFSISDATIQNSEIQKLLGQSGSTLDLTKNPDITTKQIIEKATKRFFEVFNTTYMGDILRFVYNTGRYGSDTNVRVDSVPVLIAKKDILMSQALKDANTAMEQVIGQLVQKGLSRNIPISLSYTIEKKTSSGSTAREGVSSTETESHTYKNYFFWQKADGVANANQCSIVRGSSLKVEANHGYDIQAVESDVSLLTKDLPNGRCFPGGTPATNSYWGGNSPLNLDMNTVQSGSLLLKSHQYAGFSKPIFDIAGSKEISTGSILHTATPLDCFALDFLEEPPSGRDCLSSASRPEEGMQDFSSYYHSLPAEQCTVKKLFLNGSTVKTSGSICLSDEATQVVNTEKDYYFKKIPSFIEHTSPTDEEYGIELKNLVTPSLPADRDRYIDFVSAKGSYAKIEYPNFFRIHLANNELSYESARKKIKELLDTKSTEINKMIIAENPSGISGIDRALADLLASGTYPQPTIDLYSILSENSKALEMAVESVLWKNLDNATLKYSLILEHSLDIDGQSKISADGRKNDYEIATLGAPGDARNMYVKVDPEAKAPLNSKVSHILDAADTYYGLISGSNAATFEEKAKFNCGPPEGVPIWEWIPAIFCWLGTILPPTISAGSCTSSTIGEKRDTDEFSDPVYQTDSDKNGILDGYEIIKNGELKLSSPTTLYSYDANIPLIASLTKNGKVITIDSYNKVEFSLAKLTTYTNGTTGAGKEVVYDVSNKSLDDISRADPYLSFKSATVPAQNGVAKYSFTAKNTDVDAVFEARILTKDKNGEIVIDKTSAPLAISIRSERISVRSKTKGQLGLEESSVIEAGDGNGILFSLEKVNKDGVVPDQSFPYTLQVTDDITGDKVLDPIVIQSKDYLFRNSSILEKAGVYRFTFVDKKGVAGYTTITVLPASPVKIETVPSSNTFVKGEKVTVLARLIDTFGNYANANIYQLSASVSGGNFIDKDGKNLGDSLSKWVIDGYASFDVTSSASNNVNVKFHLDKPGLDSPIVSLRSVDFAKIGVEVEGASSIVAGKEKHRIKVRVLDKNGQKISGFNSVASFDFPKLSGIVSPGFTRIADGESTDEVFLTPQYVAGKDLKLSVQIPWVNETEGGKLTVLPDVPMSFSFANQNARMEAKAGNASSIRATLYDRYGNIAYNTENYKLSLSIPEEYKKYTEFAGGKYEQEATFSGGTLEFDAFATPRPGKGYIVGKVSPDISSNNFTISDKSGKSVTVKGISENISVVDTYYLFNEAKVDKLRYDALYTALLGGEYGDVTKFGYLWGAILFNPDSKSLAVTSLLNAPWKRDQIFWMTPAGKYTFSGKDGTEGFQTEISGNNDQSFIAFYDSFAKEYVARAWLDFDPDNTDLFACQGKESTHDIKDCQISDRTSIIVKGFDTISSISENGYLALKTKEGSNLVRIDKHGKIEKYPGIDLELDGSLSTNMLGIKVLSNRAEVGYIGIKFASSSIEAYPTSAFPNILSSRKNSIIFEALSNRYSYGKTYLGNSSRGAQGIVFYSKDSTTDISVVDPVFAGRSGMTGFEEYPDKTGIGWEGSNRTFLEVAAGSTIGESTKFYQTFSTVTLGDAVAHLPRIANASNFDHTIGKQVSSWVGEQIETYKKIDFNGDGVSDIVIFYKSGKIQLLANYGGTFKDMGYLAYVSDAGDGRKWVGDFFHDGYDDITLADKNGRLVILDNNNGKFSRNEVSIINGSGSQDSLKGAISQLEVFDMDHDGFSDIVTVDDSGELNILYGGVRNGSHIFTKKLVDSGLGISISPRIRNDGGAFRYDGLPELPPYGSGYTTETESGGINQALIDNAIYYRFAYSPEKTATPAQKNTTLLASVGTTETGSPNSDLVDRLNELMTQTKELAGSGMVDYTALDTSSAQGLKTFIRSPFAEGKGLKVEKQYKDINGGNCQTDDKIQVTLVLTNTTSQPFKNSVYLDSNDSKIFKEADILQYALERNGTGRTLPLKRLAESDFDYAFDLATIAPGESITIKYQLLATAITYGKIIVGLLEAGEKGDDPYGDIAINPNNMCGGTVMIWRSVEPYPRSYEKGTRAFIDTSKLPDEIEKNAIDKDGNGIPDYIDELKWAVDAAKNGVMSGLSKVQEYAKEAFSDYTKDTDGDKIPDNSDQRGTSLFRYDQTSSKLEVWGLSSSNIDAINSRIDDVVRGLGCGFGGWSCINSPLNWAPLAPGSAPTVFGFPTWSLSPGTGIPVFSALTTTTIAIPAGPGMCAQVPIPTTWPPSPVWPSPISIFTDGYGFPLKIWYLPCGTPNPWWPLSMNAGGYLGTTGIIDFFRLFITPTITGAVGVAACFGVIPMVTGRVPPPWASPVVPGGNCVVAAKPFLGCKDDGSDGDAGSIGLGFWGDAVNANSCRTSSTRALTEVERNSFLRYVAGDRSVLPEVNASIAQGGGGSLGGSTPLIGIGLGSGEDPNFEVAIDTDAAKNFDFGNILKIKNTRVSAFPDFIMEWVSRQLEEVVNKLTSLPTLYVVLPDFSGFDTSGYTNFPEKLETAINNGTTTDQKDYADGMKSKSDVDSSTIKSAQSEYNALISNNSQTINSIGKNVSGIKAAYEFISHLPLIKLENEMVDVSIPWMSPEDADKWYTDAKMTARQWRDEISDKKTKWSKLANKDGSGVDEQVIVRAENSLSSLEENIRIIDEYRRFPQKLQKYLTWKERYAGQILCNVEAIETIVGGWLSENGQRFRAWVELYILIKAILKSWQLIIDLFNDYNETCAPCRNERWDLKHFLFKLISAAIPSIPIIQFPKWPDIWLDLHNIRAGLQILMPEFHFNIVPIVLPHLPELHLPDVPTLGIGLPSFPLLPRFPELPELPDLPSLPLINLPSLPPPPTIPKLLGSIAVVLDILRLVSKVLCIMQMNPFVPEWRAGDQIAQMTERSGKLPIDFFDVEFPNFSLPFVDALKVSSFVNFEFEVDFILEMARSTLDPLNRVTNNVSNIGSIQFPDVNLKDAIPDNFEKTLGPQSFRSLPPEEKQSALTGMFQKFTIDIVKHFIALNQYVNQHAKEEAGVSELKSILSESVVALRAMKEPKAHVIADTLQKAVEYDGSDEIAFISDLKQQNDAKFKLLKEYVISEKNETTRLKSQLDEILRSRSKSITPSFLPNFSENIKISALNDESVSKTETFKKRLMTMNDAIIPSLEAISSGKQDSERSQIKMLGQDIVSEVRNGTASFAEKMKKNESLYAAEYAGSTSRLLADNAAPASTSDSSATSTSSASSWYSYKYTGIYIRDAQGKQTRLFDYTDALDGSEEPISIDIDGDGDQDILYRMENNLYIKENHSKEPDPTHNTDSPRKIDWQDFLNLESESSSINAAPNFFEESFVSSNEIDFSFNPVNKEKDNLFRLEFYDYIDRFDRLSSWETHSSMAPLASLYKVDLIPDLANETMEDVSVAWLVARKNIARFEGGNGEAELVMKKYDLMTPDVDPHRIITVNRTIYTDAGGATIEYLPEGESERKTFTLSKNTNLEFLKNSEIWVTRGNVYLFWEADEQKTVDLDTLRGLPFLPGTKLSINNKNASASIRYFDDGKLSLDGPVSYEYYPLGSKSDEYNVTLAANNDWYYAELYSFANNVSGTIANLKLLSPQKESDKIWPLITFGDTLKIPVYQKQTVNLQKYIEDISWVAQIYIDSDLTKDSDGDGDATNDHDSTDPKTTYGIKQGNGMFDLEIGPFDSLFSKKIRLYAVDTNKNITSKDLILYVYAPSPEIRSVSGSIVSGQINEAVAGEPIDLFRFRNGTVTKIDPSSDTTRHTKENGGYDMSTRTASGLVLRTASSSGSLGKEIAWVDEKTGKIDIKDSSYSLAVIPASSNGAMRINLSWPNGNEVFSESFALDEATSLQQVNSFDWIGTPGVYLMTASDAYNFTKNRNDAPFLPEGGFIVWADKKAIAGVSKWGAIYILEDGYRLAYDSFGQYIVIRIVDQKWTSIASILYRISAEYVVK